MAVEYNIGITADLLGNLTSIDGFVVKYEIVYVASC
jgi:hypothetical protein